MALAVPNHSENEADLASRRLNSLELTRNKARRKTHGRTLRSRLLGPHCVASRGKIACVSQNTPTPCPPRGAVPVNRGNPCCDASAGFRQELGKECDANHAMRERLERTAQRGNPILIEPADLADVGRIEFPFADTNFTPDQSESGNGRRGAAIHPESATGSSGFHTDLPEVFKFGQSGHLRCALVHTN